MTELSRALDGLTYDSGFGQSPLQDLAKLRWGGTEGQEAAGRLLRARVLTRAPVGSTLLPDIPGLVGASLPLSGELSRQVDARTRSARRVIDLISGGRLPSGARPWLPTPGPVEPAPLQSGEKEALSARVLDVKGGYVDPDVVGAVADVPIQLMDTAGAAVQQLLVADATAGVASRILELLVAAAGTAVGSLADGVAAVESAGFEADAVIGSRTDMAGWIESSPDGGRYYGDVPVVFSRLAPAILVLSLGGVYCQTSPTDVLRVTEASIGGLEVGVLAGIAMVTAPGAVAAVELS